MRRAGLRYENLVRNLPDIIRETVKPMENIESIKILQVDGVPGINSPSELNGGGAGNGHGGGEGPNMTDRVVQLGHEVPYSGRLCGWPDEGAWPAAGEHRQCRRHVLPQLSTTREISWCDTSGRQVNERR